MELKQANSYGEIVIEPSKPMHYNIFKNYRN